MLFRDPEAAALLRVTIGAIRDASEAMAAAFEELSTGTKQKLSLAKALINDPELLLLDEPTVGLDPDVARRIRDLVKDLHRKGRTTILLTTHNMREAEFLCEQVTFIKEGVIRASGTPQELKRDLRLGDTIFIAFDGAFPLAALQALAGIYGLQPADSSCRILVDDIEVPGLVESGSRGLRLTLPSGETCHVLISV